MAWMGTEDIGDDAIELEFGEEAAKINEFSMTLHSGLLATWADPSNVW